MMPLWPWPAGIAEASVMSKPTCQNVTIAYQHIDAVRPARAIPPASPAA